MRALAGIALFVMALAAQATHIIGGELFYSYQGNNVYLVTVKIYRDCGPANTNNQGFDDPITVGVFDENGIEQQLISLFSPLIEEVPIQLNNPCLTAPPTICVEQATYTGEIVIPGGQGFHTLSFQRCCRSPAVINLANPNTQGLTVTARVPDIDVNGENSSPQFSEYPPIALCIQQNMAFSHAATDADGDELVYDLCAPWIGGDQFNPLPIPSPPPYQTVTWANGYSVLNMINANPALTIDPNTGFITLTPSLLGSFTVGVRVREMRNGVQLSEVIRDFRFDVVNCQVTVVSSIQDQDSFCEGLTVDMENSSTNGDFFHWDFGVAGMDTDTSAETSPTYTYPAQGTYTVMLIANPGWPCADTSTSTFDVYNPVTIEFERPPIRCVDEQPFAITAIGDFTPAANVSWTFDGGVANDPTAHTTHPVFMDLGTHGVQVTVEENGCTAEYSDSVTVHPRPVPMFYADSLGCAPLGTQFSNASTAWTPLHYNWDLGDGTSSTDAAPFHEYADPGLYSVELRIRSDSGCIAEESLEKLGFIRAWPQPHAYFTVDPRVGSLLEPEVTVTDGSTGTLIWDFEVDGMHYDDTVFTHVFDDAGWFNVTLVATSGVGCSDTLVLPVFIGDHLLYAPNAFTPNGDGMNDVWMPQVKGARLYQLNIFNRWGENIFSTTDPHAGWDGANAQQGTYAFKIWLSEWGPLEHEYNGSITLVR